MIFVNEADFFASFTCCALRADVDLVQRDDLLDLRNELLLWKHPGFAETEIASSWPLRSRS